MLAAGRIEDSYRRRQFGLARSRALRGFASKVLAEAVFCLGAVPGSLTGRVCNDCAPVFSEFAMNYVTAT